MRKNGRKLLFLALALVMVLAMLPTAALAADGNGQAAEPTTFENSQLKLTNVIEHVSSDVEMGGEAFTCTAPVEVSLIPHAHGVVELIYGKYAVDSDITTKEGADRVYDLSFESAPDTAEGLNMTLTEPGVYMVEYDLRPGPDNDDLPGDEQLPELSFSRYLVIVQAGSEAPDQPTLPSVEDIPATGTAVAQTQNILLDGKTVQFQYYAVQDANGNMTNYVKLRDLALALNGTKAQFNVGWDGKISITSNTAYQAVGGEGTTPYSGDQPYQAVSGTPVNFNGKDVNLTSFSITYQGGGYTYYKLRDLGQLLGFNVKWDGTSVVIETDQPYTGQ